MVEQHHFCSILLHFKTFDAQGICTRDGVFGGEWSGEWGPWGVDGIDILYFKTSFSGGINWKMLGFHFRNRKHSPAS